MPNGSIINNALAGQISDQRRESRNGCVRHDRAISEYTGLTHSISPAVSTTAGKPDAAPESIGRGGGLG